MQITYYDKDDDDDEFDDADEEEQDDLEFGDATQNMVGEQPEAKRDGVKPARAKGPQAPEAQEETKKEAQVEKKSSLKD